MLEQRKFEDAEASFRQELGLREEGRDSVHSRAIAMGSLAYALAGQGRLNDACQILAQAQALLDELGEPLQSAETLRSNLDNLQRFLDETQHGLVETRDGAASPPP